ncbi:glycerol-3-phosphate phosphatase [Nothobranchius furzeri]|uniref:Glycerol-3-phosphate phosphatase n=1 Tax=Nothobranchius furzeri TaxID=105023 RepID=A0A1A7Z7Z9_NOTFU|nr:glycerol-3-phosphate phosphatase [Nothobranchius furzeri]XP_015819020.1 glycerol-3-phosphate phosphatase [Nothobranchius furzeri]XP_015819021.1 glycerol-3-phosphate phosphatase [Nothobranchius furzeri]KAF7204703.1 transcript variant X2 [Nothobranchius furzeri]KAF7204704.1 transcript variant X3 [Nothobranchius furzeri]KAF7204705.1 transcript variant X1 [Nothobranchius furzeri]
MSGTKCTRLNGALVKQVLDSVDSVLFDCDGVIWRGDQSIPGAPQVINLLKEHGKKVFFVTNNSSKTRKMYADKMTSLGFGVREEEVFGTAYCCAMYLKTVCKLEGKVYLLGSNAMEQELEAVGIQQTGVGPDHVFGKQNDWASVPLDPEVKAVVVGFDEHFSYMKLNRAMQYLIQRDCLFVGTNRDTRLPLEGGKAVPGTGCLLQAVETAAQRQAQTVGKPNHFMFDCVASQFGVNPDRCLMVGDRLDTDILLGSNCGLKTLLTLTGVSTVAEAEAHWESGCSERKGMVPDYYVESIADLLPALQG